MNTITLIIPQWFIIFITTIMVVITYQNLKLAKANRQLSALDCELRDLMIEYITCLKKRNDLLGRVIKEGGDALKAAVDEKLAESATIIEPKKTEH